MSAPDPPATVPQAAPLLSIVPCMYRRRTYIVEALRSVQDATRVLPAGTAEVVLVADEVDEELQLFTESHNVRVVRSTAPGVGQMMLNGLTECRGRYVAFFDDDDLVDPQRFLRFLAQHAAHPGLTYYHNGFLPFRDTLPERPAPPTVTPRVLQWPPSDPRAVAADLEFLAGRNLEQNLSSTIVRRDALLRRARALSEVTGLTDTFVFFVALLEGGTLIFDEFVGTWIRRHPLNTTASPRDLRSKRETRDVLRGMVRASKPSRVTDLYARLRRARDLIFDASRGDGPSQQELPWAVGELLRMPRSTHPLRNLAYVTLGLTVLLAPGLGRALGRRLVTVVIPEGVSRL